MKTVVWLRKGFDFSSLWAFLFILTYVGLMNWIPCCHWMWFLFGIWSFVRQRLNSWICMIHEAFICFGNLIIWGFNFLMSDWYLMSVIYCIFGVMRFSLVLYFIFKVMRFFLVFYFINLLGVDVHHPWIHIF